MPSNKNKRLTFANSVNRAIKKAMKIDKSLICYGLGVSDPKNVFNTTKNLKETFGLKRVFDVPACENTLTGVSIGLAIGGIRSVVTHQRLDFFLLAMDQLVNSAAKWYYMFGSQCSVPITIRLIVGRGWGQGPTHSQNLHSWFAHIPGLKVIMPTFPIDAENLLIESIFDKNPVLFIEQRWLHNFDGIPNRRKKIKIGQSRICKYGKDVTIVAISYLTIDALEASKILKEKYNIDCEVIDIISVKPLDYKTIFKSVKKTNNILVLDVGAKICSFANEIIANVVDKRFKILKSSPVSITMPDVPVPTSFSLTKNFYPTVEKIVNVVIKIMNRNEKYKNFKKVQFHHDIPGAWFKGPF